MSYTDWKKDADEVVLRNAQIYAHADKIIKISKEEWNKELEWQKGRGLREIIENVINHLKTVSHMGAIGRIVELETMLKKLKCE